MERERTEELARILATMADQHGWHRAQWLSAIDLLWRRVVGDAVADHTRIITLTSDNVLVVGVPSSVWAQELQYYKPTIMDAIRLEISESRIRDIRTRVRTTKQELDWQAEKPAFSPYFAALDTIKKPATDNLHALFLAVQEKYEAAARDWMTQGFHACAHCRAPILRRYTLCIACEAQKRRES